MRKSVCIKKSEIVKKTSSPNICMDFALMEFDILREQAEVRITYCDHSWKKEMSLKKATVIKPLDLMDPSEWNENDQPSFDVSGTTMKSRET